MKKVSINTAIKKVTELAVQAFDAWTCPDNDDNTREYWLNRYSTLLDSLVIMRASDDDIEFDRIKRISRRRARKEMRDNGDL